MKFLFLSCFLWIITFANAQPGDQFAMRKSQLLKIEKALQNDPNNVSLIWERLELTFDPHFNLYAKGKTFEGFQQRGFEYPYYILEDLNYLIANQISIKIKMKTISLANFYFKRGQLFYVTGYREYALDDYLVALKHNPAYKLKQEISLSIAAYYYNTGENYSLENYEIALFYIDLVTPKEDINKPFVYEKYSNRSSDYFQTEKIQLLKASRQEERLVTYLKCIAKNDLLFFEKEQKRSQKHQQSHSYTIKKSLQYGLDKLYEIAVYFYETGNYKKAKEIIEKVIPFIPKNTYGHYFETYAYGRYFVLLSKIYGTNEYENVSLEIENLLEGFGDPTQGLSEKAAKQYERLEVLLALYPYEAKLHLAKAIYLRKIKYNGGYRKPAGNPFESLQQCEELGLQDYRIPYLRALLLREEKRYAEALVEINKAQLLCSGYVNVYGLKLYLLQNVDIIDEAAIQQTKSLLEASKKQEKVNVPSILEMIHAI
ncbi:hypothetical protein IMCC3317_33380 [Kordia antarctica]|uniref:Tetratricopeptide repeat protein n=1 Tax=Kordia antarctica TaxID=1218801 RepID=A0A7L4ZMW3_9FLAO|nr:hypothetical protein [Kordia antarctica]QHI37955.1 hypothetical protein IMCC3317_33380 [Kordia antarctica]